ncbi:MAG: hypothetical protein LUC93_12595 [Planctomycetaceae bacterium]|nr:hypothetical protein [Planctomycetaceae bacterium]
MWDNETTFSNRQTLADGPSETAVDVGPDDIGLGEPVYLQVSLSNGASGALEVTVETGDAPDLSDAVTLVTYHVAESVLKHGGTVLAAPVPTGCRRYLRLQYDGASGGTVTAGLVQGAQTSGMNR